MKFLLIALMVTCGAFAADYAHAQEAGYSPPPMFEEPTPLPPPTPQPARTPSVVKQEGRALIAPRVSPRVDLSEPINPKTTPSDGPVKKMAPIVERRSSPQVQRESKPVPVPPKKPQAPAPSAAQEAPEKPAAAKTVAPQAKKPVATPATTPATEPPKAIAKPVVPKAASVVKHDGYVTGPKTMPAVPTQNVDAVAVFAPEDEQGLTIMERHQRQEKAKKDEAKKIADQKLAAKKAAEEVAAAPPEGYEKTDQDALKKILPYEAGTIELGQADMKAITEGIVAELAKRPLWRVQIQAYASLHEGGLGSDKRIALGRAMTLRKSLLDQGVAPEKIDMRAEGAPQDGNQLADRVDLYLFGPAKTAEKR